MTINGKTYETPSLNFSSMCRLEEMGLLISDLSSRPLGFLAGFVALAIGADLADGQAAIDEHLKNGGELDALTAELDQAVDNSVFFRAAEGGGRA